MISLPKHRRTGYTIVELSIVILVIGLMATIGIVGYRGLQTRAKTAAVQDDLRNAFETLATDYLYSRTYPTTTSALKASAGTTLAIYPTTSGAAGYCLQAINGSITYSITNTSSAPVAQFCTASLNAGLIGRWKLDGNAVNEVTGTAGTVNGATLTQDRNGTNNRAYLFAGTNYINLGTINTLPAGTSDRTIAAWVYPTAWNGFLHVFHYGTATTNQAYGLAIRNSGTFGAHEWGTVDSEYAGAIPLNTWSYLTLTLSGTSTKKHYVNGELVGTLTRVPNTVLSQAAVIGSRISGPIENFIGKIDDVRVYSRALSDAEIAQLYLVND